MVSFKAVFVACGLWALSQVGQAVPTALSPNLQHDISPRDGLVKRAKPGDFYLRIMPLGASITAGSVVDKVEKPPKNGYRKPLRDKLRHEGWDVNMVGNFHDGPMNDNVSNTRD